MKQFERYKKYKEIAKLFNKNKDIIEIYRDEADGAYFHKLLGEGTHRYVDNLESDGTVEFNPFTNIFDVEGASCVVIKTFDNESKADKKIGTNYDRISIIINDWGYGILQSVLLSENKNDLFTELVTGKYLKGSLDDYDISNYDSHTAIVPVIDKYQDMLADTLKDLENRKPKVRALSE